jgi:GDP-mannose 6-dehydrogenase
MVEILVKKNYEVSVYDKNILLAKLTGANKQYMEAHIPAFQTVLKDNLKLVIKESEVVVIINDEVEYIEELKSLNLNEKTIVDMVRIGGPLSCLTGYKGINW